MTVLYCICSCPEHCNYHSDIGGVWAVRLAANTGRRYTLHLLQEETQVGPEVCTGNLLQVPKTRGWR